MRIGVIGSGVAGSLLLEALDGAPGIEALGFERARAGDQAEAGTGLNLGPNALKALRLHMPRRHAALRAAALPWRRWTVDLTDGTRLLDLDLLEVAEEPGARIRWAELYALLRAPVAHRTLYGHALEAVEEDAAGRLVPVFRTEDGALTRHGAFDLLVGGDGRYSQLRALTAGPPVPEFMGICIWRLLVQGAEGCPYDDYGQWFGGNARLLSFRVPGDAVYVAGSFPVPPLSPILEEWKTAAFQEGLFLPKASAPCPDVAWMLGAIRAGLTDIHWARQQVAPLLRGAADGRVLFLGDAAQAMVPTLGQGATQAIEDGVLAGSLLRRGGTPGAVAALRDARVEFVRDFSVEASDTMRPGADVVAGTAKKNDPPFRTKLRRLYTEVPGLEEV